MNALELSGFLDRVQPEPMSGCWLWTGTDTGWSQYGQWRRKLAHRLSYEHFIGTIPEGLVIDHLCRVRFCVNPNHLEAVSARVNQQRMAWRTHCKNGHEYIGENVRLVPGKSGVMIRICRVCARANMDRFLSKRNGLKVEVS